MSDTKFKNKSNSNTNNQSKNGIVYEIKDKTAGIKIKTEDINDLTIKLKEWNDCVLNKKEPKDELKEIQIDDFIFTYDEFKNLVDNGLLSQDYYKNIKYENNKDNLEADLDQLMPSMSKDGIFNMMIFNLAKHSSISDKVELHYLNAKEANKKVHPILQISEKLNSNKISINNIIEESKEDGKVHFILGDIASKEDGIEISSHVTPYIVVNGEIFEFDSVAGYKNFSENPNEYSTSYIQQSEQTSCKAIAIREVDNFLKMLKNFDSIEEFSGYLKQFFSENRKEYYVDPDDLDGDLIEGAEKNARLAILPFPILKNSQSLSSLKKTLIFIQNLNKKYESLEDEKKEEFIKKYKHILEMEDKLKKLIKRFEIQKRVKRGEEAVNINAYTLKERLRQAKTLAILLEKGKTKSLENVEDYRNTEKGKTALATVNKEWIKEINNNSVENNEKEFTFLTTEGISLVKHNLKTIKNLNELTKIIYNIDLTEIKSYHGSMDINNKNIETLNNALIYFIKNNEQNEFKEFLNAFRDAIEDFNYTKLKNIIDYCNNNLKRLAEEVGIEDFNVNIANDSIDELYDKLNQIAEAKVEIKEDKDLDENDLEMEVEDKDLDEIVQNLSSNLDRLNSKEKSENSTVEEINSIKDPMEAYNKIIVPALEGINNINININSITALLKTDIKIFSPVYKKILRNNLKKFINNLPEENREKLKNNLSKEGVKEKLNEVSEKSGIKLGDALLKDLNEEKVMVRRT